MSRILAVRGAITVPDNTAAAIREATARLLRTLLDRNRIDDSQIVSAIFTATPDLNADFPAHAARMLGWTNVPLLGAQEVGVPGALPRVVRVLLTVANVPQGRRLRPAYLEGAAALRPDLADDPHAVDLPAPASRSRASAKRRIAIIGVGQVGGSLGLALAEHTDWWRTGFDVASGMLNEAVAAGAVDEAASSLEAAVGDADLVVLAVPVDVLPGLIARAAAAMREGAVLVDTGSARGRISDALREVADRVQALGMHPLAGTDAAGFGAARADMFDGAAVAVCLDGGQPPDVVRDLIHAVGAHEIVVDPGAHDRALARTSHLPYLVSRALERTGRSAAADGLSGPGFRDMTRLARSDARMAEAYCRENASEVEAAWLELRSQMERVVAELGGRRG